jgi:hypothetical protein
MTREQKLEAALRDMVHAVCGPTGLHEAVKFDTGMSYPWPALDLAEDAAMLALTTPPDASWEDRTDEFTGAIDKAHPHHTKDFPTYTKALELVSNRHSKGALVGLVNYLLSHVPAPNPDTRAVTVDQLNTLMDRAAYAERFHNSDIAGSIADEILAIIRDVKP